MHLYILTRGIFHETQKFITELQGKYLPFKWRNTEKGEKELSDHFVQLSVRPIQLFELVFPEEQKEVVFRTVLDAKRGEPNLKKHKKHVWAIRKALGLKEIPKYDVDGPGMPISKQGLEIVGIGIKEDYWHTKDDKHVKKKEDGAFEGL